MIHAAVSLLLLILASSSSVCRAAQTQCVVEHSLDGGSTFQRIGLLQLDDDLQVCQRLTGPQQCPARVWYGAVQCSVKGAKDRQDHAAVVAPMQQLIGTTSLAQC
jgi:hypothetical protein